MIAEYYSRKKRRYAYGEGVVFGALSVSAVIAWIAATIVGFTVTWGIACINTLVASFLIYLVVDAILARAGVNRYLGGTVRELAGGATERIPSEPAGVREAKL
jgi:cytosine permease